MATRVLSFVGGRGRFRGMVRDGEVEWIEYGGSSRMEAERKEKRNRSSNN